MARTEIFQGFVIELFESAPGEWRSRVRRLDGATMNHAAGAAAEIVSQPPVYSIAALQAQVRRSINAGEFEPIHAGCSAKVPRPPAAPRPSR